MFCILSSKTKQRDNMQQSQRCEVRAATLEDVQIILDIQAASYPAHILEEYDVFASMIKAYPQGISYNFAC